MVALGGNSKSKFTWNGTQVEKMETVTEESGTEKFTALWTHGIQMEKRSNNWLKTGAELD